MAPVVHGLEKEYEGRIDFLYLNVAETRNDSAKPAYGFRATPHLFLLSLDGAVHYSMQGLVSADSLKSALDRLLASPPLPSR